MRIVDLTGQKFGRLTVIGRDILTNKKDTYWLCECDCTKDRYVSVAGYNLKSGHTHNHVVVCTKKKLNKINTILMIYQENMG